MVIWSFTAVLGQLISKSALILVWYRLLIACVALFLFLLFKKHSLKISTKQIFQFLGIGALVLLHWLCFYGSIKVSKISVALIALSSITVFTGILDPVLNGRKVNWLEIIVGLIIFSGIILIFKFEFRYALGTFLGLIAAFLASLFTIFNSWEAKKNNSIVVSFYELLGGFLLLTFYLGYQKQLNEINLTLISSDLIYLLILGIICTAVAYVMGIAVMRTLSPFTVNLITSLEPVYGIVLAFLIFGKSEAMRPGFYVGALVILITIFSYPLLKNKLKSKLKYKFENTEGDLLGKTAEKPLENPLLETQRIILP